jgi:hypothetical protein
MTQGEKMTQVILGENEGMNQPSVDLSDKFPKPEYSQI